MLQWPSSQKVKRTKNGQNRGGLDREEQIERVLERERELLSKNKGDPTVGSLRDKKENCSTRRGQHVDTGFVSF